MGKNLRSPLPFCILALFQLACVDVRSFAGDWQGEIVESADVRQGFSPDVRIAPLRIKSVDLRRLSAEVSTTDARFRATPLIEIRKAAGDALASLSLDTDPLRSFLMFSRSTEEQPSTLFVVSLFSDDHIELRAIQANELYGVFYLERSR